MDIATQSEIFLRDAGYETWAWSNESHEATCFENATLIGFVHVFSTAEELLSIWESAQQNVLSSHSALLQAAGDKAWNVYSVFLSENGTKSEQREVERIEEDFSQTRKIARTNVRTQDDIERTLLLFTAVRTQSMLLNADFENRFRSRMKNVSEDVLTGFLGGGDADDVARMLLEKP